MINFVSAHGWMRMAFIGTRQVCFFAFAFCSVHFPLHVHTVLPLLIWMGFQAVCNLDAWMRLSSGKPSISVSCNPGKCTSHNYQQDLLPGRYSLFSPFWYKVCTQTYSLQACMALLYFSVVRQNESFFVECSESICSFKSR